MNILPKKSWHVGRGENIERVRRDEEKDARESSKKKWEDEIAEYESQLEKLKKNKVGGGDLRDDEKGSGDSEPKKNRRSRGEDAEKQRAPRRTSAKDMYMKPVPAMEFAKKKNWYEMYLSKDVHKEVANDFESEDPLYVIKGLQGKMKRKKQYGRVDERNHHKKKSRKQLR